MPALGTGAVHDMFPVMEDIVSQLVAKWERFVVFVQYWKKYTQVPVGSVPIESSILTGTTPS